MHLIDEFKISRIHQEREEYAFTSKLLYKDQDTGVVLKGLSLEAQFKVGHYYILFLTEDCPFEEGLYIYLIDQSFKVLDRAEIGMPYISGILRNLKINNDHEIQFSFFSDDSEKWVLTVLPAPRKVLTYGLKVPVKRPISIFGKRYFDLRCESSGK